MFETCFSHVLVMCQTWFRHVSDMIWSCFRHILVMSQTWFGHVSEMFRSCLRHVLAMSWTCFGHHSDIFWASSRHVLECILTTFYLLQHRGNIPRSQFFDFLIFIYCLKMLLYFQAKKHPKHVQMMPKTCPNDDQNMSEWCLKHVRMMPKTCPKHVWNMTKTCLKHR